MRRCSATSTSRRATAAASCSRSTASRAAARSGRPVDWFYYVNGIEADDRRRGAQARARRPRLVGPPRLERRRCGSRPSSARSPSRSVRRAGQAAPGPDRLRRRRAARLRRGARAARGRGRQGRRHAARSASAPGASVLRVLVGRWSEVRGDPAARQAREGPEGVRRVRAAERRRQAVRAARPARARPCGTLGAGRGLVAATRFGDQQPTWVVTGTDAGGRGRGGRGAAARSGWTTTSPSPSSSGREVPVPLPATATEDAVSGTTRDLPPPRQPAARGARGRRLGVLRRARGGRRAVVRAPAACSPRCCWPCSLAAAGARVGRVVAPLAAVAACRSRC